MPDQITITLPDGSERPLAAGSTAGDLAASIGRGLAKAAVIASVNGVERDLDWALADGDDVAIIVEESDRGLYTLRHSTAHVLAQAVLDLFPGATFAIGPPIDDGFYYDFELPGRRDVHRRRPRAHRRPHARDHRRAPALRPRRDPRGRGARAVPRPPVQGRDHRGPGRRPDVGHRDGTGPHLRQPAALHRPVPWPARARTRADSATSSSCGSPAPTGAATRRTRCSSASTARPGRRRRTSPPTSSTWRRPRSATTASSAPSSTCSRSPTRSARAWPCSTRRAASSGG